MRHEHKLVVMHPSSCIESLGLPNKGAVTTSHHLHDSLARLAAQDSMCDVRSLREKAYFTIPNPLVRKWRCLWRSRRMQPSQS